MFLARVTGNVVASQKDRSLNGQKLLVVEPLNVKYDEATKKPASLGNTGRAIVMTTHKELAELKCDQVLSYGPDPRMSISKGPIGCYIEPAPTD